MITSYAVGAVFEIIDRATPTLRALASELRQIDTTANAVRASLTAIENIRFTALARSVGSLERNFSGLGTVADRAALQINTGLSSIASGLATATTAAAGLATQLRAVAAAGAAAAAAGGGGAGAGAAAGAAAAGAGGGAAAGAARRGGGRHGIHSHISSGVPVLGGHARFGVAGSAGLLMGGVGAFGIVEAMKESMEPMHQQVLYRQLGASPEETKKAIDLSFSVAKQVPGTTVGGNLALIADLRSVVGPEEAFMMAPNMAKIDQVLTNLGKGEGKESIRELVRSGEITGQFTDENRKVDTGKFNRYLDFVTKAVEGTHGTVNPRQMLNLAQQGGPALGALSEEGWLSMAVVTQSMKGNRAGTAMAALQRQFQGGKMTKPTLEALIEMGLARGEDFETVRGGHIVPKTGAMKELVGKFQHDPFSAFSDIIIPQMEKKGIKTIGQFTPWAYKLFGTGPSQRAAFEFYRGGEQFTGERERIREAMGLQAATAAMEKDPEKAMRNFTAAFTNMLGAFGSPLMEAVVPRINALANAMNSLASWFHGHPTRTKVAGEAAAGGAGGMALGALLGIPGGPVGMAAGALALGTVGAGAGFAHASSSAAIDKALSWIPLPTSSALPSASQFSRAVSKPGGTAFPPKLADNIIIQASSSDPDVLAEAFLGGVARRMSLGFAHNQDQGSSTFAAPGASGAYP